MNARQWLKASVLFVGHMALAGSIFLPVHQAPEWIAMAWLGALMGQITILSTWSAMASWREVMFRAPTVLFLLALWWLVFVLYLRINSEYWLQLAAMIYAAIGVCAFIVVFALVRLGSWLSRWRFTFVSASSNSEIATGQFRIAHMLGATAGTAILLGLGRVVLPAEGWSVPPLYAEVLMQLGIAAIVIGVNTLVMVPACLWAARQKRGSLAAFLFVWPLLVTLGEVGVLKAMDRTSPDEEGMALLAFNIAQGLWLVATLLLMRWAGWGLERLRCPNRERKLS